MELPVVKTEGAYTPQPSASSLWKNRNFLCILSGYAFSIMGNGFHSMALSLWVLQKTGSAKLMSIILLIHIVISLLFGTVAGTFADRTDRRKLMWISDAIRGGLVLGIATCVAIPGVPLVSIFILTGLVAVAGLFQTPARQASLIDIVGHSHIQQATGAMSIADNAARISGFALGGAFIGAFGGPAAIAADAFTFLLSAALVLAAGRFPSPAREGIDKPSFASDLKEGFAYIVRDPFARAVTLMTPVLAMFFLTSLMLIQVSAVKIWEIKPALYGIMEASIPAGYLIGSAAILLMDKRMRRRGWWICGGIVLSGPVFIGISMMDSAAAALPLIPAAGFLFSFCTLLVNIILRIRIRPELQGRVFGLMGSLGSVAPPLGLSAGSFIADRFGPAVTLFANGIGFLALGLIVIAAAKTIRQFD